LAVPLKKWMLSAQQVSLLKSCLALLQHLLLPPQFPAHSQTAALRRVSY
jgi:hypothetical protein